MNNLLLDRLLASGQLEAGKSYDMDFDHQFIETEKYDARNTYKRFKGYGPGMAAMGALSSASGIVTATPTYDSIRRTRSSASSAVWKQRGSALTVPVWIVAHAHARLSGWWRGIASVSISAPTDVPPSMMTCSH